MRHFITIRMARQNIEVSLINSYSFTVHNDTNMFVLQMASLLSKCISTYHAYLYKFELYIFVLILL